MKPNKKSIYKTVSISLWITIWHYLSKYLNNEIILPSPIRVFKTLIDLFISKRFWLIIFNSSFKILLGFFLALLVGIILATISHRIWTIDVFITMPMKLIKASPIASFVILALLWVRGKNLSVLISFLMVMPIVYENVKEGIKSADIKLLEMSRVFKFNKIKLIKNIYIPAILPYLSSAITIGISFCFKAGIAAEVIGIPKNTIGYNLYDAKLNLLTNEVLAWTLVIIIISFVFERIVFYIIKKWRYRWMSIL